MLYKKIIITGGCGFLGQHLIMTLRDRFQNSLIEVLDLNPPPAIRKMPEESRLLRYNFGTDIRDKRSITRFFKDADLVIHLAGLVTFSLKHRKRLYDINVKGTENVLQCAYENSVPYFIHVSSVAALGYSDNENNPVNEDFIFDWKVAAKKRKYYMLSKHNGDEKAAFFRNKGMNIPIVYPGLMFGPGDIVNSAKLINAILRRKIPFNMPGGTNIVDVRDVAAGIIHAIETRHQNGDYLLSGHNLSFTSINSLIADKLHVRAPGIRLLRSTAPLLYYAALLAELISSVPLDITADNIDSSYKFRYFDNSRAKDELGWEPRIPFEKTVEDTIKWMEEHDLIKR